MSSSEGIDVVVSDELIERNFKTFRSYIETCVKVTDLIVFYDLFTTEQTKKFRQLFKSDPTAATSMAFDEIVLMDNQPDKYMRLLLALKDAGYPKIERILTGELLPVGSDHRHTIRKAFKDIYQNLIPREVLSHLLAMDVISDDDYEEITAAEKNYSTGSAAMELLTILPNRHKDWYMHFIQALVSSSHEDLAKTIDKDLATRMIENRGTRRSSDPYVPAYVQASCQRVKDQADIMHPPRADSHAPDYIVPGSSRRNPYVPRSWDKQAASVTFQDVQDPIRQYDLSLTECSPCQYANIVEHAMYFCTDCSENLCAQCKRYHLRMKVTRSHRIIEGLPDSVKSNAQTQSEQSEERPYCACGLREIEEYCKAHDDAVCKTCKARKHVDCITCPLGELTESFIVIKLKHVTKKTDEIQGKLEKMLVEGEEAQRTLWESYRKCENDIYQIAAMIADAQFYGKDRELAVELERIEHEPQRMLADQIEACRISIKKLSNQYKCTQKYKVAEEKDKALDSVLQLSNILKDVKGVIQEMGGNIKKTNLVFKANENLDILERLKNEKWGEIKLETAE